MMLIKFMLKITNQEIDLLNKFKKIYFFNTKISYTIISKKVIQINYYYLDFETIKIAIDNNINEDIFFDWYDYQLEEYEKNNQFDDLLTFFNKRNKI